MSPFFQLPYDFSSKLLGLWSGIQAVDSFLIRIPSSESVDSNSIILAAGYGPIYSSRAFRITLEKFHGSISTVGPYFVPVLAIAIFHKRHYPSIQSFNKRWQSDGHRRSLLCFETVYADNNYSESIIKIFYLWVSDNTLIDVRRFLQTIVR